MVRGRLPGKAGSLLPMGAGGGACSHVDFPKDGYSGAEVWGQEGRAARPRGMEGPSPASSLRPPDAWPQSCWPQVCYL